MKAARLLLLPAALAALSACTVNTPKVSSPLKARIPDLSSSTTLAALSSPDAATISSKEFNAGCVGYKTVEDTENADGTFRIVETCDSGGLSKSVSEKTQVGDSYTITLTYDDGSEVIWAVQQSVSDDQNVVTSNETNNLGETRLVVDTGLGNNLYSEHGDTHFLAGEYIYDFETHADGSSHSVDSFDDPATAASPDWSSVIDSNADGSAHQLGTNKGEGYTSSYTYDVDAQGKSTDVFSTDLTSTQVNPDFQGTYRYNADFSGEGEYTEAFDDGSSLSVKDTFDANGSYAEDWSFNDAATEQALDSEGHLDMAADGSFSGTVTTHPVDGAAQTCDMHIDAAGAQTIDNCR